MCVTAGVTTPGDSGGRSLNSQIINRGRDVVNRPLLTVDNFTRSTRLEDTLRSLSCCLVGRLWFTVNEVLHTFIMEGGVES